MANKAATVYLLDLSPSMGIKRQDTDRTNLEDSLKVLTAMIQDKVIAGRKTDMVGVVLYGTEETENQLANEPGQYEHVKELFPISQPNLGLLRDLNTQVVAGLEPGDILDAIIVSINMINTHCRHLKYEKKIVIFTDAETPTNISDVEAVEQQFVQNNIGLTIVGIDFDDPDTGFKQEDKSATKRPWLAISYKNNMLNNRPALILFRQLENEALLHSIISTAQGTLVTMPEALAETNSFRTKPVKPTTVYQGHLTLGEPNDHPDTALAIPVHMYPRTYELKPPTAKKYSALAETGGEREHKTYEVTMSRTFKLKGIGEAGDDEEVPKEDLEKAYMYGKTIVPIRKVDEEVLKLETTKGLAILGFLSADTFPRDYSMSNIYAITPPPHDLSAAVALSALARGLQEKNALALVRYVARSDMPPKLGLLFPEFQPGKDVLYFTQVPFAEDVRRYTFASLDKVVTASGKVLTEHKNIPTEDMLNKTEEFIRAMDLMSAGKDDEGDVCEYLLPEDTFNPTYQRINRAIKTRALNPAAPIPPPPDRLLAQLNFVPELVEGTKELVEEMKTLFDVKKIPKKSKSAKRGYGAASTAAVTDVPAATVDEILNSVPDDDGAKRVKVEGETVFDADMNMNALTENAVRRVGTVDPVADFKSMIANRKEDLVTLAVQQMEEVIKQLVTTSFGDQFYDKAIDCLNALREVCASENESDLFNTFLPDLRTTSLGSSHHTHFWERVVAANITLISSDEAPDSKVGKEEADKFLHDKVIEAAPQEKPVDADAMDADDLLNMME